MDGVTIAASAVLLVILATGRRSTEQTSLQTARHLAILAAFVQFACAAIHSRRVLELGWGQQMQFGLALLWLVPPMAVLGARRPGASAWNWFVLLPMVVVLGWPAAATWRLDEPPDQLLLEGPQWIGIALALTMGCGNYFGTRYTMPALAYAAAVGMLIVPFIFAVNTSPSRVRMISALLMLAAAAAARWFPGGIADFKDDRFARLWIEFRDLYGIVWAKRVMDRLNEAAASEGWNRRIRLDGFESVTPETVRLDETTTDQRIEHWLRVLLRRFVDSEWIVRRISRL